MERQSVHQSAFPRIVMAASEHQRLLSLAETSFEQHEDVCEYLIAELSRAFIVPDEQCATNVVRMGSSVTYREDDTGRVREVTLVYPKQADIATQRVSILTPIGAALIGLSPAQSIQWSGPDGDAHSLTVLDVRND